MKWKKWIAAVMVPMLFLYLIGNWNGQSKAQAKTQTTAEEKVLENALKMLGNAESVHTSLAMDMEVKVFWLKTGFEASMDTVSFRSPLKLKSQAGLDLGFLGDVNRETYVIEQDGGYQLLRKAKDGWNTQEITESQLYKYDGRQTMQVFLEQIEELKAAGTGKVDGKKARKYTGVVDGAGLEKILIDTGSLETLSILFQDSMLSSLGTFLEREEEIGELLKTAGELEMWLWIDAKTGYPLQCSMDVTEMMGDAYKQICSEVASGGKEAEKDLLSRIEITETKIVMKCSDFNEAEEFVVPGI